MVRTLLEIDLDEFKKSLLKPVGISQSISEDRLQGVQAQQSKKDKRMAEKCEKAQT